MLYYSTTVCTTAVMQCVSQCDTVQFSLVLWKPCLSIVMLRLQVRFSLGVKSLASQGWESGFRASNMLMHCKEVLLWVHAQCPW